MTGVIIHPTSGHGVNSNRYLMLDSKLKPVPQSDIERSMIGNLNGGMGIKKTYITEADGSVTMMSTKNGMPEIQQVQPPTS